jgi:hypothetical protein
LLWAAHAHAALGSDIGSVREAQQALHGSLNAEMHAGYSSAEISTESGIRICQYLNERGVVFAAVWSGPIRPDLQQLLGRFYPEYAVALKQRVALGRQRALRIVTASLVVELGGHLRAYEGRAYVPSLMPAGLSLEELR